MIEQENQIASVTVTLLVTEFLREIFCCKIENGYFLPKN